MATLYQRNGQYYLNYSINGRRVRKSVGKERKEAEIYLEELHYKLFKGDIRPEKPEIPIEFFFDRYLANCNARLTKGTNIRYRNAIKHFREFFYHSLPHSICQSNRELSRARYKISLSEDNWFNSCSWDGVRFALPPVSNH